MRPMGEATESRNAALKFPAMVPPVGLEPTLP